jgi:hypothetical protein
MARLMAAVRGESPPGGISATLPDDPAPYRGLAAFDAADARFFHGRAREVQNMVTALAAYPFLAVIGPSGSGKTSLVLAGLLPTLKPDAIRGVRSWRVVLLRPGAHPLREIAAAAAGPQAANPQSEVVEQAANSLSDSDRLRQLLIPSASDARTLLIIDRFEELFTMITAPADRDVFVAGVRALVDDPQRRIAVVCVICAVGAG